MGIFLAIAVVHPFGKDLGFKPHVHCISTEGGFTNDGRFIGIGSYINYDALHREWQYAVLEALRNGLGFLPQRLSFGSASRLNF